MIPAPSSLCLALAALAAAAQEPEAPKVLAGWEAPDAMGTAFGYSLSALPDIDGDGLAELLVGSPWENGDDSRGSVWLFSGGTGELMLGLASKKRLSFGDSVAYAGDLDGDEVPDFVAGAGNGSLRAFSGQSGQGLWVRPSQSFPGTPASRLARIDVDGDGLTDLAIWVGDCDDQDPGPGEVHLVSGANGDSLKVLEGPAEKRRVFFECVESVGDTNGDGMPDFLTSLDGNLQMRSGADGSLLRTFEEASGSFLEKEHSRFSRITDDRDGDGWVDLLTFHPEFRAPDRGVHVLQVHVRVVSSRSGQTLDEFRTAKDSTRDLTRVFALGDLDADGVRDFAFGFDWPGLQVYSGKSHRVLAELQTQKHEYPSWGVAWDAVGLGDLDDDGHADFAYSLIQPHGPGLAGHVVVVSGKTCSTIREHTLADVRGRAKEIE